MPQDRQDIALFPLNTVLFPDGVLPLKVFEQRYIDMTKACLRDSAPFGVCLIREGREVGEAALPEDVGCLATIAQWDMPQLGVFQLLARGGQRFRVLETRVGANQLVTATVTVLPPDREDDAVDPLCGEILKAVIDRIGAERFPGPVRMNDGAWVCYRLAELLPLENHARQEILQLDDVAQRFARLRRVLAQQGLAA